MPNKQAIIQTPEDLLDKIKTFPDDCKERKVNMTYAGFAMYCGYANKQSLHDLRNRKEYGPEFKELMGIFKLMLEEQSASNLLKPGQPTAGNIFNLVNNCGDTPQWTNRQDISSNGGPLIQIVTAIDREEKEDD